VSTSRDRILERLRANVPERPPKVPKNPVRRFDWSPDECLERFRERLDAVRGEVHLVGDDWPRTLFGLLRERGVGNLLYGPSAEAGGALENGWPDAGAIRLIPYLEPVETCRDALFNSVDAGFTGCLGAVAETGSLVLWPTPEEPRLMSLVPPIHCVLLDAAMIASTFHALMADQDWVGQGMPTNALLITGPSKSADIEQTLAYGVHGPKELIVLVRRACIAT
jgi:L-lactate dehydrogenase complex protein LldG